MSVIVPAYNLGQCVIPCLKSILGQTYSNIEIIVVDDGSTDDTFTICRDVTASDRRVRLIHAEHKGLSSARNIGLDNAMGDYIMFVDGDDLLDARAIDYLVWLARRYSVPLVTCCYEKIRCREEYCGSVSGETQVVPGDELLRRMFLFDGVFGSAWAKLYAASLRPFLEFPEGQLFEDICAETNVFKNVDRACISSVRLYGYVMRPGSITNCKSYGDAHIEGMEQSIRAVREVVSDDCDLVKLASNYATCCQLRVASKIDPRECFNKAMAENFIEQTRRGCWVACKSSEIKATWRMRCALFAASPMLYKIVYRLYCRLVGRVC